MVTTIVGRGPPDCGVVAGAEVAAEAEAAVETEVVAELDVVMGVRGWDEPHQL